MIAYEVVRLSDRLPAIAQEIVEAEVIGLDIETTGLSPHSAEIRLVQLNTGKRVYVVDAFATKTLEPVIQALRDTKAITVGHNLKFESKFFLHKHGLELWPLFDTYRASALIYNGQFQGKGTQDLYALYGRELQIGPEAKDCGASDWSNPLLTQEQLDYAAEDVVHLLKLRTILKQKLRDNDLNRVALIEFLAILPEAAMELAGFYFDAEAWTRLAESNKVQAEKFRRELINELPHPAKQIALPGFDPDFNLNSPQQLLKSLRMVGLRVDNTSEITLAMFAKEFPVVQKILDWREYGHAVKMFGIEYLEHVNPLTKRIHTNYFPFTGAGRYASSNPNCFDDQTEVLTKSGWKLFSALKVDDLVAQWADGVVSFVAPTARIVVDYDGDLVHLENEHIDIAATPDHRCLLQHRKQFHFKVFAAAAYCEDWRQLHGGLYEGGDLCLDPAFLQLLIAVQADGSWSHGTAVDFSFTKKRKIERLRSIFVALKAPFTEKPKGKGVRFKLQRGELSERVYTMLGPQRLFGPWVLDLTADLLALFEREVWLWDGLHAAATAYGSGHKSNADWVQVACLLRNRRANVRFYDSTPWGGKNDHFIVDATSRNYSLTTNIAKFTRHYKGKVYCVSVPSGFILVRRNGKAVVTGNCQQIPRKKEFRSCFRAAPGRKLIIADYGQIELRVAAELANDRTLIGVYQRGEDAHAQTAAIVSKTSLDQVTKSQRQLAKPVNFGLIYGMQAAKLVLYAQANYGVSMTLAEAELFRTRYFEAYSGVRAWHRGIFSDENKKRGIVRTIAGRLRYLKPESHNEFSNTPVQGSSADGLKTALRIVYERIRKYGDQARMIHMVHDEIIVEADDDPDLLKSVQQDLEEGMVEGIQPMLRKVPVVVEGGIGETWADKG